MPFPNDEPQSREFCGKQAVEEHNRAGHSFLVCATCGDQQKARDALEDKILHIVALTDGGRYDDAIACLDAIVESNCNRDHDGWLARSVAAHRALIFFEARRYADAEQAWNARAQLGFADVSERWEHAQGAALVLNAQGRTPEAAALLEDALGYTDPKYLPSALGLLTELARLSEKLAQPVNSKWLSLAEAVAERYGVDMPASDSLGKAILTLRETVRGMAPKRPGKGE